MRSPGSTRSPTSPTRIDRSLSRTFVRPQNTTGWRSPKNRGKSWASVRNPAVKRPRPKPLQPARRPHGSARLRAPELDHAEAERIDIDGEAALEPAAIDVVALGPFAEQTRVVAYVVAAAKWARKAQRGCDRARRGVAHEDHEIRPAPHRDLRDVVAELQHRRDVALVALKL